MTNIKMKEISLATKIVTSILLMIFIILTGTVAAQEKNKKSKKSKKLFDGEVSLTSFYDDNILKYSQKYLDRFMNGEDFGRFHITTYDDIVLKPSARLETVFKIFKNQKSKINANYNYSLYVVNDIKSWQYMSFGFQQYFAKKGSFRIFYSYIPEFYVRHFRDKDLVEYYKEIYGFGYIPESFVPFSFSKDNYGFWIQNTFFKNTRVKLSFDYAIYYHNENYTEYDCKNFYYGFQIYQEINTNLDIDFGYEYVTSDAKGYDQPYETKETSDDADATNIGDNFTFGITWRLPDLKKRRQYVGGDFEFAKRYYTTDKPIQIDPEHAGRIDNMIEVGINYRIRISKAFDLAAFYKWYGRDSKTASPINSEYVSEEKDYKQYQIGLELSYGFKF